MFSIEKEIVNRPTNNYQVKRRMLINEMFDHYNQTAPYSRQHVFGGGQGSEQQTELPSGELLERCFNKYFSLPIL